MALLGPYATEEDALAACNDESSSSSTNNDPYWCVQNGDSEWTCTQSATEPANTWSGPYTTAEECANTCTAELGWSCLWVLTKVGGPGYQCVHGPGGTYATEAECLAVCEGSLSHSVEPLTADADENPPIYVHPKAQPPLNLE